MNLKMPLAKSGEWRNYSQNQDFIRQTLFINLCVSKLEEEEEEEEEEIINEILLR
jgi:hypothetical protein